jgi:hypothetical protein
MILSENLYPLFADHALTPEPDMKTRSLSAAACFLILCAVQPAQAAQLDKYIGKYPSDKVEGRTLYEFPPVVRNYRRSFGAKRWRHLLSQTTTTPVEMVRDDVLGEVVLVRQCTQHNCPVQSAILLRRNGTVLATCFSSRSKSGYLVEYLGLHKKKIFEEGPQDNAWCGFGMEAPEAAARFRGVAAGRH